jgi:HprK-related kinase A
MRMRAGDLPAAAFASTIAADGVALRIPPITVRVRSDVRAFALQLHDVYRDYALVAAGEFADVDIRILRTRGLRRWGSKDAEFIVDGTTPFDPFPVEHALPTFEWGLNWVFAQRTNTSLLLHAAAVERDGKALVLPAYPGAGKSTLAASLASRDWRLLSDEFAVVTGERGTVLPFPRPPAIKNAAIDVLRAFAPEASFGPVIPNTRKGTISHMRVPPASLARGETGATIGMIAFPEFQAGAAVSVARVGEADAFMRLATHAFNYEILGERSFHMVGELVRSCPCHLLRYGDLADAHAALDRLARTAVTA